MSQITTQFSLENKVMFLSAMLSTFAMFALGQSYQNAALIALGLGAASKAIMSLGAGINAEDGILALTSFFAVLAVTVVNYPQYAIYALVLGSVAKAIPSLAKDPSNVEDWLLLSIPVITAIVGLPQFENSVMLQQIGLLFGFMGKSLAGIQVQVPLTVSPVGK